MKNIFDKHTHLCSDTHAAWNVHTEHHQCVLHVLVVIIALMWKVNVITVHAGTSTDAHSGHAVTHAVLTGAELAHPHLTKRKWGRHNHMFCLLVLFWLLTCFKHLCSPEIKQNETGEWTAEKRVGEINDHSRYFSLSSGMTRQHYISHKPLGSGNSPGLRLLRVET